MRKHIQLTFVSTLLITLMLAASGRAQQPYPSPVAQPTPRPALQPTLRSELPRLPPSSNSTTTRPPATDIAPFNPSVFPLEIGRHGILVETLDGRTLIEQSANEGFNPASAMKLVTALAALRSFGPQHRFSTAVWTTGIFDAASGTITGDLIVSGLDPAFTYAHAVTIAGELNRLGIRTVTGDLIVAQRFTMNYDWSAQRSGEIFYDTLDATRRPAAATRAWNETRRLTSDAAQYSPLASQIAQTTQTVVPSVAVMGAVYVSNVPAGARVLVTHRSSRLTEILKVLLSYSNNFMAERLGDSLGGTAGLQLLLTRTLGLNPTAIRVASTSGLGVNRLTPRQMMRAYRALVEELARHDLTVADVMPVAGVDPGTLERRFTSLAARGSVIAKTGTLGRTDGGVSALVGQMRAQNGETLYFVIFNQRGNVARFRSAQNEFISGLQAMRGGPASFVYTPQTFALRLSATELNSTQSARPDEYEP